MGDKKMKTTDIVKGIMTLMQSDVRTPVNLGNERLISVDDLAYMIANIAGIEIEIKHVEGPQGVRGRNASNWKAKSLLGWEALVSLEAGLEELYYWVYDQVVEDVNYGH